jgi:hypothetical protein
MRKDLFLHNKLLFKPPINSIHIIGEFSKFVCHFLPGAKIVFGAKNLACFVYKVKLTKFVFGSGESVPEFHSVRFHGSHCLRSLNHS